MKATVAALASLALAVATLASQPWQEGGSSQGGLVYAEERRAVELAREIPAEAVEYETTEPYASQQTLRDEFRPIQGGIQIQRVSGGQRATCTLGFTALRNDQQVFLTAGHCSPNLMGGGGGQPLQPG